MKIVQKVTKNTQNIILGSAGLTFLVYKETEIMKECESCSKMKDTINAISVLGKIISIKKRLKITLSWMV